MYDNDIDTTPAELSDDLVIGEDGAAVEAAQGGTLQLDNDTAIGEGTNGLGISAVDMNEPTSVVATNTIARGTKDDLEADISGSGSAAITLHYSDARKSMELASGVAAKVTDSDHPIEGEPVFLSATDFHEAPSSPTIDAGTADAASGSLDLDGLPRTSGVAEDIGAYEFQGALPLPRLASRARSDRRLRRSWEQSIRRMRRRAGTCTTVRPAHTRAARPCSRSRRRSP